MDRIDQFFSEVERRVTYALEQTGEQVVGAIKDRLSVPVEYQSDGSVIRSAPGESPRMETGDLREGVQSMVESNDDGPALTVSSTRNGDSVVPIELEFGHVIATAKGSIYVAPRPYMTQAREESVDIARKNIISALTSY